MDSDTLFRKLIFYINKYVDENTDDLLKAIIVYLIICKYFRYNTSYTIFKKINYNYKIEVNEIICNQFSSLFCNILRYYGVTTFICGNEKHSFVVSDIDSMRLIVDPLKFGFDENGEYLLSDFTNLKIGFKINGLSLVESNYTDDADYQKDLITLNKTIVESYKILGYSFSFDEQMNEFLNNFNNDMIERLKRKNHDGHDFINLEELDYRVNILNSFNVKGHTVEDMQFLKKYFFELFRDNIDLGGEFISLYKKDGNRILLYALFVLYDELGNAYFYLQDDNKIVRHTKDSIVEIMFKNNLCFKFVNDVDALDLDDDRKFKLIRQFY